MLWICQFTALSVLEGLLQSMSPFPVYVALSFSVRAKQANAGLKQLSTGVLAANVRRDSVSMKKLPNLSMCPRLKME